MLYFYYIVWMSNKPLNDYDCSFPCRSNTRWLDYKQNMDFSKDRKVSDSFGKEQLETVTEEMENKV